jgi:tRNA(Ile)-lysidine synthase
MPPTDRTTAAPSAEHDTLRDTLHYTLRDALRATLRALGSEDSRLVLAVSGGADSMALMYAMARWAPERIAVVATYDHGTGTHAREAASLVAAEARRLGLEVVRERAWRPATTEAGWREARWRFLWRIARAYGARVATAHTADDQLETIVQRVARGAGARGLAALAAPGPVVRPWLHVSRADLRAWVTAEGVPFRDDPANEDRRHQRVRLRLDLLPAIERVDPGFGAAMLALGERAAVWRRDADELAAQLPWRQVAPGTWQLPRASVAGWTEAMLAVVWPALLAPLGVTLTGDGTRRLLRFTIGDARAGELRLPGGVVLVRSGAVFEVRLPEAAAVREAARRAEARSCRAGATLAWPGWRFHRVAAPSSDAAVREDPSLAAFPTGATLEVRSWQAGDRIAAPHMEAGRRISRYLSEAGVPRLDRSGWPVVLVDGVVVWVPGICRGLAAPHRSGRSDLIWYRSEREFG